MEQQQTDIDIDQLASSLGNRLLHKSPRSVSCCIFKVPTPLRKHNEELFKPSLVSIGPYHRDLQKFKFTERVKLWYLDCLIARAPTPNTTLKCFFTSISANVQHCLESYAEEVKMTLEAFVEMLIIDGCFIVEFLRRVAMIVPTSIDDPLFKMSWTRKVLIIDLLLLENQLPWSVLDCLFNLTRTDHDSERGSLPQLAQQFFSGNGLRLTAGIERHLTNQNKHLLDLQRNMILYGSEDGTEDPGFVPIPCVTELLQAGVDFAVGETNDFMGITFNNGILTIPQIKILDNAESLIRNLIAYEQCDRSLNDRITAHVALLDNLINSSADLDYLRRKGIIKCYLSTEDVSAFFHRFYNDIHLTRSPYRKVADAINAHFHSRWPRWRAKLYRDYFSSPWSIISLVGAILILVLTFLQTVYVMLFH